MINHITWKDYLRMGSSKGWRLPFQYFFQNHCFDLLRGTDTHFRLDKNNYGDHPEAFDQGVLYMSSVTCEIRRALKRVRRTTGDAFSDFQYFDLGCGKGKTLLVYSELAGREANHQAVGIEYYAPLAETAAWNLKKTKRMKQALALNDDARNLKKYATSNRLLVYLYNPFGQEILEQVLDTCRDVEVYLIYTDPEWDALLRKKGFVCLHSKTGPYPNRNTNIYHRGANTAAV